MTDTDLNSGDIAEMLTAKIKTVQEAEEALRTKDIVVDAAIPDEVEVQKAKTEQTVALTNAPKVIVGVKTTSTKGKKVKDNLQVCLENFRTAPNGSSVKVTALVKMIDIVSKTPKKSVLDEVLAFFRKYKNEDFIPGAECTSRYHYSRSYSALSYSYLLFGYDWVSKKNCNQKEYINQYDSYNF